MGRAAIYYTLLGLLVGFVSCNTEDEVPDTIPVESITIRGDFITDGGTSQLTVLISPQNATNKEVTWAVSNEAIATISQEGLLTAVSNGIVIVTATAKDGSNVASTRSMQVSGVGGDEPGPDPVLVQSITVLGNDITDGSAQQLSVEVLPENADNTEITWSVSNEDIAQISATGMLTPSGNGTVTVTASATDGSGVTGALQIEISGMPDDGVTVSTAGELLSALSSANAGDKIYVKGGTYAFNSTISISRSGAEGNMISLFAYPGDERPLFDFSAMAENSSNRGIQLSGSYWHIKGIDVYNAGDNGMFIRGHNNLVEFCTFFENSDSGLQIGNGGSNNTVLNCDSYYNADSSIENADGFACKLDAGDGNKFIGCRAWNNLDDGWDGYLRGADNITTVYENCWAIRNGYLKNGTVGGGDGNGFKTGGSDDKDLSHHAIFKNCIAAGNVVDGFDHNSNRGDVTLYNCAGHDNGKNINFGSGNIANSLTIKNTVTIGGGGDSYLATTTDITNNSWQDGLSATAADYVSLDIDQLLAPRKADGSLPDVDYMKLLGTSDLINQGVDVGLEFNGAAPDVGPFEYGN